MGYKFSVDADGGTASLELPVGETLETTYNYAAGNVTLSERVSPATLTQANLSENLDSISRFVEAISRNLAPPSAVRVPFTEETKKTSTKIEGTFLIGTDQVTSVEYLDSAGTVTFAPRAEITMGFCDFVEWYVFLRRFEILANNF